MIDATKQSDYEKHSIVFSYIDYYLLKSMQCAEESDRQSNWNRANELREAMTGEKPKTFESAKSLSTDQILEYLKEKQETGITYAQYTQKYL